MVTNKLKKKVCYLVRRMFSQTGKQDATIWLKFGGLVPKRMAWLTVHRPINVIDLKSSVSVSRGFARLGIIIIFIVVVVIVCRHCPCVSGHAFPSFIFHETGDGVRRCRSGFGFTQGNHQQLSSCQQAARSPKGHVHSTTGPQRPRPLNVENIFISPTAWTQGWEAPGCAKTKTKTKKM